MRSGSARHGTKVLRLATGTATAMAVFLLALHAPSNLRARQGEPERVPGKQVIVWAGPPLERPSLVTSAHTELIREGYYVPESSTITVTYSGFTPAAQTAFAFAANIWATQLTSSVPIRVSATWTDLCTPNGYAPGCGILGSAGPHYFVRDFTGAPQAGTWYADALADKLAGSDQNPGATNPDIEAKFNSTWGSWYYGTDGHPGGTQSDFVSVVLHELGHGVGFLGTAQVGPTPSWNLPAGSGGWGMGTGYPAIYDRYVVNGTGQSIINTALFANPSAALGSQLTSNNLYWDGAAGKAANGGARPRLYAPAAWSSGSSYAHLDESTYPAGNANSLMTPAISGGEAIHDPGPITRGIFTDSGWTVVAPVTPTLTSVSPNVGYIAGGLKVTLTGTNFTGATSVTFGGTAGTSLTVVSATQITVVTPAHAAGAVAVTVTVPTGSASLAAGFTYTATAPPVITALSPFYTKGGTGAFTLTITGTGFVGGSTVRWDGNLRTTTYVSATQLTASILAADVAGARLAEVKVTNPDTQFGTATFIVTAYWWVVGAGDFNADGKADLVFESTDGYIGGWGMNGFNAYAAALLWPTPVATGGWHIKAIGDLNGDGWSDLIWENTSTGYVAAWIMNGITQVSNALLYSYPVAVDGWHIVGAGDFNGDGMDDIVWQKTDGYVAIWYMNGTTQISNALIHPAPITAGGWAIVGTGDFNKDGQTDILLVSPTGTLALWVMSGGTISSSLVVWPDPVAILGFWVVATGDFNADLNIEIIWEHLLGVLGGWTMNGTTPTGSYYLNPPWVPLKYDPAALMAGSPPKR